MRDRRDRGVRTGTGRRIIPQPMRHAPLTYSTKQMAALLVAAVLAQSMPAAVRGEHAAYIGGTAPIPREIQGSLDTWDTRDLQFRYGAVVYAIPYGIGGPWCPKYRASLEFPSES